MRSLETTQLMKAAAEALDALRAPMLANLPTAEASHRRVAVRLGLAIARHAEVYLNGQADFAPACIELEGCLCFPDLAYFRRRADGAFGMLPELLAEVLLPETAYQDLIVKRALYARNGIQEYWVLDPASRLIEQYELHAGDYLLEQRVQGHGFLTSKVVSGLLVQSASLFD
jgi:Uma2 family endonuclease